MKNNKFIFKYKDFKKSFLNEDNINNLFDVPGLHYVSVEMKKNEKVFEIITSNAQVFISSYNFLKRFKDLSFRMLKVYNNLYSIIILSRYENKIAKKIKILKNLETFELFDIFSSGFFGSIEKDLLNYGADKKDIEIIKDKMPELYDTGHSDLLSPEGKILLIEYLNTLLEYSGAKIYTLFQYLGKESIVFNFDDDKKHLELLSNLIAKDRKKLSYKRAKSDYEDCIDDIIEIVNLAAKKAEVSVGNPYDYYTNRDVNATTIYMAFPIKQTNLIIKSILSPVELVKITGGDEYIFDIEDNGFIDGKYMGIKNESELAKAILELI